jgi:hypothetical protein
MATIRNGASSWSDLQENFRRSVLTNALVRLGIAPGTATWAAARTKGTHLFSRLENAVNSLTQTGVTHDQ